MRISAAPSSNTSCYHLCDGWTDLACFGRTGGDQGRDIIGTRPFEDEPDERTVIQASIAAA
ncbi:hypothetical protein MPLB_1990066 [Mesorhizobium sp. ORS 3324]|nr:hypothetical protein MPLB_1990066 [Mesorhizobium sp. ORS 3324]CDX44926.1 hypothetical protein MPLA_750014 [Mesorhizobium sp. ORS 3359]